MGIRSKVNALPEELRRELEQRLIRNGFSDYDGLVEWLVSQGFEIHRSSVYRFGSKFEDRLRALKVSTEKARAVVEASPDDAGDMSEALTRLTQQAAFDILMELELDPETIEFPKLVRAIADINRSSVTLKKYQAEARVRIEADLKKLEAEGYDKNTLAALQNRISIYLPNNGR